MSGLFRNVKKFRVIVLLVVAVMLASSMGVVAFAYTDADVTASKKMYDKLSTKDYPSTSGGKIKAKNLIKSTAVTTTDGGNTRNYYYVDTDVAALLTSSGLSSFLSDVEEARSTVDEETDGDYSSSLADWVAKVNSDSNNGTQLIQDVLQGTSPDFNTAATIYKPMQGFFNGVLGVGAVLIMAILGVVMVLDIAYIALPPVRMFASDNGDQRGDGRNSIRSHLFSAEAINAVRIAEDQGGANGNSEGKQALGIYLKRRVWMLLALGLCLLFLIQGKIYTVIGWVLDFVSGFLGV